MAKPLPTHEMLRKALRCCPDAGKLWWRVRPLSTFEDGAYSAERLCKTWNAQWAGKEALTGNHGNGYKSGGLNGRTIYAHRAIWALIHGEWPGEIDHINGDRSDNRLINLRIVTRLENTRNARMARNNSSGVTGVCWDATKKKWAAYIGSGENRTNLGNFKRFDNAVAARKQAERRLGYHPNHGRPSPQAR